MLFASESCYFSLGTSSCKLRIALASSCTRIIRFRIVRNSVILILSVGFGGISCSRIRFCKKSFALLTIRRNRFGSQPLLRTDWLTLLWISVCWTSMIFASEIPDTSAISAVLFHSCLAALSASIELCQYLGHKKLNFSPRLERESPGRKLFGLFSYIPK